MLQKFLDFVFLKNLKMYDILGGHKHGDELGMITVWYVCFLLLVRLIYISLCINAVCVQQDHFDLLFDSFASPFRPCLLCMLATNPM